jgi:hypothetical protein
MIHFKSPLTTLLEAANLGAAQSTPKIHNNPKIKPSLSSFAAQIP